MTAMVSSSSSIPAADHTLLILPFLEETYLNPSPFLPIIQQAVQSSSTSVLVIFSTPGTEQLYDSLRKNPQASWDGLQRLLGTMYGSLAGAQWASGRVLMDVEVRFEGDSGVPVSDPRLRSAKAQTVCLEGYEDLPIKNGVLPTMTSVLPCPSFPFGSAHLTTPHPGIPVVALGGTFDHLHAAHKLLLHLALFLTTRRLIVGVMSDKLLASKSNADLVEPLDMRIRGVEGFLGRNGGSGVMDVLEIHDPLGPTGFEPDIQALVVSRETISGGRMVNRTRHQRGLGQLDLFVIDVIAWTPERHDLTGEMDEKRLKELKMGSTGIRQWIRDQP